MADERSGRELEQRAKSLFVQVSALPPSGVGIVLDRECGNDLALREYVESLLTSAGRPSQIRSDQQQPPSFPGSNSSHLATLDPTSAPAGEKSIDVTGTVDRPAMTRIGPYKLLQIVGEGGFGSVWIADQQSPVKRRVAIKIIKPGMDSHAVIARFEQERQALALMDHPNIARVYDAGTAPDGRPFFVMEYVAGEPITGFCDRHRMNVRQRLELFISVCEAVQHAHHKGIIHRDIKPGNVLVTNAQDSSGDPSHGTIKVIDFGVAKAVSHVLTDKTIFTEQGQILGTPEYMSPEQAEMGAMDIDTRTDVYALGVLLYELLAGALPFEPKELRSKGYNEIQRIIREVEPPRPSNRLRSLGAAVSTDVAARRKAKLDELEGQLRRELEWIPLKAMRKDRNERYATPMALADDIRNHLSGMPLVAGPETVIYRARKFVYRNRWGVTAAGMVTMALIAGAIVSTIGFYRAAQNRDLYRKQYARADEEAARQRQINTFTNSLLSNANPLAGERKNVTVRELLDDAVAQLDAGAQANQPRIEAAVRRTLAQSYRSLSLWPQSEKQWQRAFELESSVAGSDSAEAAVMLSGIGQIQMDTGRLDAAEKSLSDALAIQRERLAPDDPDLGNTINNLGLLAALRGDYKTAQDHYREALQIYSQRLETNAALIADATTNLAATMNQLGDPQQALELARRGLTLRRKATKDKPNIDVWNSLSNIASMQETAGDLVNAEAARREALELIAKLVDEKNRYTVISLSKLARTLWLKQEQAAMEEARQLQSRALDLSIAVDGEQSRTSAEGMDLLACIARDQGQLDRAIELFRKSMAIRSALLKKSHPETTSSMLNLADALTRAGRGAEAIALAKEALELRKQSYPPGHWGIWNATSILGGAYAETGDFSNAEPMLLEAFDGLRKGSGLGNRPQIDAGNRLARMYEKWGKVNEAETWRKRSTELQGNPKN